jgi:hypothetical protein
MHGQSYADLTLSILNISDLSAFVKSTCKTQHEAWAAVAQLAVVASRNTPQILGLLCLISVI